MKTSIFAACAVAVSLAGIVPAQAQTPAIATIWGEMDLNQDRCLARSRAVFEDLRYQRIESIGYDTFADYGRFQVGIRCVPAKQMYYVYGGGPGDQDKQLIEVMNTIKREFGR
jgi:hypothetical protein